MTITVGYYSKELITAVIFYSTYPKPSIVNCYLSAYHTDSPSFSHQFVCLSVCSSICLSVHLSICPFVHLSTCPPVHLSTCPPVHLSTCPPVHLSTCPPVHLSICLFVYLSCLSFFCLSSVIKPNVNTVSVLMLRVK
jgi:hypothetical protein